MLFLLTVIAISMKYFSIEEESYPDELMREYNFVCYKYYNEKMGLAVAPIIEKKEVVPPKDPDFWNLLN